jgi:glutamate/tyrosine decarboxylase-like PLP-dependent enzyme
MFLAKLVTFVSTEAAGQLELYPAATLLETPVPPIVGALAHLVEGVAGEIAYTLKLLAVQDQEYFNKVSN